MRVASTARSTSSREGPRRSNGVTVTGGQAPNGANGGNVTGAPGTQATGGSGNPGAPGGGLRNLGTLTAACATAR